MAEEKAYRCEDCGDEQVITENASVPECCGEKMKAIPLENCTKHYNPEGARLQDDDDACDDGVH